MAMHTTTYTTDRITTQDFSPSSFPLSLYDINGLSCCWWRPSAGSPLILSVIGKAFQAMALSPSSFHLSYQNENIIKRRKETSSSIGSRASGNVALCCWKMEKPWPKHHFLKGAILYKSSKCESKCEFGSPEPAVAENMTISRMGDLNVSKAKVSVNEFIRPQKRKAHLEIQISARQSNMDNMTISRMGDLNVSKAKVSVNQIFRPQKREPHLEIQISARQSNIYINRWNRENESLWVQEAIDSAMKWIANVSFIPWITLATIVLAGFLLVNPSAYAVDALKTCECLLKECRGELARCIANPACAANIACLQTCNNRPDETECQIKCGDLFENSVVDQFNECAVSRKKCVPQKYDDGQFSVPDTSALVKNFNIADFNGKWYISSGLNPTFDTFDCQVHEFYPTSNMLTGKLTWRITTPDGGFITRSAIQKFVQDPSQPGILYNHNNEYLHYQDDWYILSSKIENKPDDYIFVYYRGKNDAWDGYGGAVVYTRSPVLPPGIVPELEKAASRAGLNFNKFRRTDNTCGPEPPLFARLERKVEEGEQAFVKEVEDLEEKAEEVGRAEMILFQRLGKGLEEFRKDEENLLKELNNEERQLLEGLKMGASEVEKLFGKAVPIRKLK